MNKTEILTLLSASPKPLTVREIITISKAIDDNNFLNDMTAFQAIHVQLRRMRREGLVIAFKESEPETSLLRFSITDKGLSYLAESDNIELIKTVVRGIT